jgi:4-alpha-glucanotransferase
MLARSRSRLVLVAPYDVIGETRQPNLPGTVDEYPNWRLPLPLTVEQLMADERVRRVVEVVRAVRG